VLLLRCSLVQALQQIEDALRHRLCPQLIVHGAKVLAEAVLNVGIDPSLLGEGLQKFTPSRTWLGLAGHETPSFEPLG